ncbi:hypothetical protein [Halovivax gelatinilyticus]|uniref:hypothetical protein n=1 Tax=Halovivax gelatinilyticus TaxID=2961597 RepID=UPI0020CA5680|nr:hypothetical protein [Halovivax gelatinilyticus]
MAETPTYRHGGPVNDDESDPPDDSDNGGASIVTRLPLVGAILTGAGAFALTTLTTLAMAHSFRQGGGPGFQNESLPHVAIEAVWTVLVALGTELQLDDESIATGDFVVVYAISASARSPAFHLFAFGVIVVAGYATASYADTRSIPESIVASLLLVPGYFVLVVAAATLATWSPPETQEVISPSVSDAALYAGLVWPAAFAATGGLLAVARSRWGDGRVRSETRTKESA